MAEIDQMRKNMDQMQEQMQKLSSNVKVLNSMAFHAYYLCQDLKITNKDIVCHSPGTTLIENYDKYMQSYDAKYKL